MKPHYHRPVDALDGYVRTVLHVEDITPADTLPILPQGTAALVCLFEKERGAGASLFLFTRSIHSEALRVYSDFFLIAYFFHPFVTGPIFGIPAKNSADHPTDLRLWNEKIAGDLLKKLKDAGSLTERSTLLDTFLQQQILKNQTACEIIRLATDRIVYDPAIDVLPTFLSDLQTSERTLQRVFKKYVGCSPGQFRRLCQFYAAFHQLRSREFGNLSEVAYDQGYADQSHFIRSFREFSRKNPGDYMRSGLSDRTE